MQSAINWQQILALVPLGIIVVIALAVAVLLFLGLFGARSLMRRELAGYFLSPIAYVVLVVFLLITGFSFYQVLTQVNATMAEGVEYPMQALLGNWWSWLIFLVIPPV